MESGKLNRVKLILHVAACIVFVAMPWISYVLQGTSLDDIRRNADTGADMSSFFVKASWFRFSVEHVILVGLFYTNYSFVLPKFPAQRKTIIHFLGIAVVSLVAFSTLNFLWHNFIDHLIHAHPMPFRHRFINTFLIQVLLISGAVVLRVSENNRTLELAQKEKEKMLLEAELKFLRSQINPHFLFNSLNNIYSQSLTDPTTTSGSLLQLSSLLRFLLHESGKEFIPVSKELEYIRNYVALESVRLPGTVQVELKLTDDEEGLVHPMLLIPFIENAFKYGVSATRQARISICIEKAGQFIRLVTKNDIFTNVHSGEPGGIGIANTRRRLQLMYPDNHELRINVQDQKFIAELSIPLHENPLYSN